MTPTRPDVNKFVQIALSAGVLLSFLILIWGSALFLVRPAPGEMPRSIPAILRGVAQLDPAATISLGLLVLLITPVARVIAAMIGFVLEGDRKYALISLGVLAILVLAAAAGR